jgi:uncharacterized HAD superfamily protein
MKKYSILIIAVTILLFSCSDNVKLTEADVIKYDWLKPFLLNTKNFSGYHNLDLGTLSFKYEYDEEFDQIRDSLNNVIDENNWEINLRTTNSWQLKKNTQQFIEQNELTFMYIKIDSIKRYIIFEIK